MLHSSQTKTMSNDKLDRRYLRRQKEAQLQFLDDKGKLKQARHDIQRMIQSADRMLGAADNIQNLSFEDQIALQTAIAEFKEKINSLRDFHRRTGLAEDLRLRNEAMHITHVLKEAEIRVLRLEMLLAPTRTVTSHTTQLVDTYKEQIQRDDFHGDVMSGLAVVLLTVGLLFDYFQKKDNEKGE